MLTAQTKPRIFSIRNTGTGSLNLGAITVTGTNAADFALTTAGITPTVAPGASTTLLVVFQPTSGGAETATLTIPSNDANENPFVLNLSGTGNTPPTFSGYSVSTASQTPVTVSPGRLLANAADADGHALSVSAARVRRSAGGGVGIPARLQTDLPGGNRARIF